MPGNDNDTRPGLAIITNSVTPYGVNLHRTIAQGIPELKLHVLVSHWAADFKWRVEIPPEVHVTRFGAVNEHPLENPFRRPIWGWRKGGRFICYFQRNRIQAAIFVSYRFISYMRLMNYCYRSHIPFFVSNDSNIRCEPRLPPLQKLAKNAWYDWWVKRASGAFSMGRLGDQFFIKYGVDPQRIYRVPCWPDFNAFAQVDQEGLERFRQKYRLKRDRRYLMYAGRLVPDKRVDLLIDSFQNVAGDRPNWDLMIVGDGVLREELQRRVPAALQQRVIWTGFLDGSEPAQAYHAADVLVLPSDHEPWALVVQEAMAAGSVVVSSNISGAAYDMVEDGRSGKIFPAGNLAELTKSLLEVTAPNALPEFKEQSRLAFARWRTATDPVAEIRRALGDAHVLRPAPVVNDSIESEMAAGSR